MDKSLIEQAIKAKENSYAPISNFKVGAAIKTKSGKVYTGCNIENSTPHPCLCAEQVALSKAISEGEREFVELAVAGDGEDFCYPCGTCRQLLNEWTDNLKIYCANKHGETTETTLSKLFPFGFKKK